MMGTQKKKSTLKSLKTGAKVAKTVATSRHIQNATKILFAATAAVYLRRRTMKEEGIL